MPQPDLETEVKFYVQDLPALERRLKGLGAKAVRPRTAEVNLRFDSSAGDLRRAFQVLRLRRDERSYLTFKGPSQEKDGILSRQEIELTVDDFEKARRFLEVLGFEVIFIYEKYRSIFTLSGVQVMLDELPYGSFIEIEGEAAAIRDAAQRLELKWEHAVATSYHVLFERTSQALGLTFRDLTYVNFAGRIIRPEDLGVQPAD